MDNRQRHGCWCWRFSHCVLSTRGMPYYMRGLLATIAEGEIVADFIEKPCHFALDYDTKMEEVNEKGNKGKTCEFPDANMTYFPLEPDGLLFARDLLQTEGIFDINAKDIVDAPTCTIRCNMLSEGWHEHPVSFIGAPKNRHADQKRLTQIIFEAFILLAIYVVVQVVLAKCLSGRTMDTVMDVGSGIAHTAHVYEGCASLLASLACCFG
eukprot:TRINITY_DN70084_c0_g1_i1.p1 TRINITY_DN70084_c0_g1~~TRINITY_DN70084_c0_g1_i1.p1  ORF type:complete len:237 (+),score=28.77 TRINITY_DN70084_c0_g1_i1:83-712(+)